MGFLREDSEAGNSKSLPFVEDSFFGSLSGPDPPVLSSETNALGFHGDGLSSCALEIEYLPEGSGGFRFLRCPTTIDRQRAYVGPCRNYHWLRPLHLAWWNEENHFGTFLQERLQHLLHECSIVGWTLGLLHEWRLCLAWGWSLERSFDSFAFM